MTAQLVLVLSKVSSQPSSFQTRCYVLGFVQKLTPQVSLPCYAPGMCKPPLESAGDVFWQYCLGHVLFNTRCQLWPSDAQCLYPPCWEADAICTAESCTRKPMYSVSLRYVRFRLIFLPLIFTVFLEVLLCTGLIQLFLMNLLIFLHSH